jgi:hypothetical protein
VATTAATFSPDGRWIAVGTYEGAFVLDRNERTWRLLRRVVVNGATRGLVWWPDGRIGGDGDAVHASWFRVERRLLASLVRGSSLEGQWKAVP